MKRSNGILSLLLVAAMLLSLCACGQGDQPTSLVSIPENSPVSVPEEPAVAATMILTDNLGRQVELPCPVERCAVALRYTNELIRACGAIDKVIAVDLNTAQDRDYWGMFDPNEVIGKGQRELDYEKIVQLAPQVLILPANGSWEEAEEKLAPFGIPVFIISGYDTMDFEAQCRNIGRMFGVEEQAERFCSYFTDKLAYIDQQLEGVAPRTYYYEGNADHSSILPGDTFYDMFRLAHAKNIFDEDAANVNAKEVDPEEVIRRQPEVIIKCITPDSARAGTGLYTPPEKLQFQQSLQSILARPAWQDIPAVRNGDIYYMTQFSHGGACKLVGTMYIAKWLYPDLLPDLDPDEVFRAWLEDFQGFRNIPGHFYTAGELAS